MTIKIRIRNMTCALAAGLASGTASAADYSSTQSSIYAPPQSAFSWTGFYAGLNAGGGFSTSSGFENQFDATHHGATGMIGGLQGGYNYQLSPLFVVGIENDFEATGISTGNHGAFEEKVPFFGTGRARAGVALLDSHLLLFGTGGLAFGQVNETGLKKTRMGWTAGSGVEWAFLPNWSARLEYLYSDLERDYKFHSASDPHAEFQTVGLGINYHFR